MDDCYDDSNFNNALVNSSSYIIRNGNNIITERNNGNETADHVSSHPLGKKLQGKKVEEMSVQVTRPMSSLKKTSAAIKNQATDAKNPTLIKNPTEPYCQVKLDSLIKLKDSTKKLLCLLEEIQSKTHTNQPLDASQEIKLSELSDSIHSVTDVVAAPALKKLETQTRTLGTIYVEDDYDDCSIFRRLTRKCHCLNQQEYNDFIIHFNEDTKYYTSTIGEIIKNMRILKKFLYMGGRYTKNALIFLNEGLSDSTYTEKVEITQGCSHSDMCNVFEDQSIVIMCVSWPCKFEYYGDTMTQNLAAAFVHKLAQLEEGRRYLKFTSKITNDIKKVLRKKGANLDMDTTESLNAALNLINPPMTTVNVTYYCRPINEGYGNETVNALLQYREYMTLNEIFTHLDFLNNISNEEKGKIDLTKYLPSLLNLFKQMLKEYDNSEMNIIVTNILNNIVSKNMLKQKEPNIPKTLMIADTATEPIQMKNEIIQMPPLVHKKRTSKKSSNKCKSRMAVSPNKYRQASKRKVSEWDAPLLLNRSRKFAKERSQIIVVPIEK